MKCIECGKEFESERTSGKYCSASCRVKHNRRVSVTDSVTDVTVKEVSVTDKKVKYLSDLGVDLKELGVQSCGPGLPILLVDMPTIGQIQSLCKVIHALKGDMEWEPRCGMGNSF